MNNKTNSIKTPTEGKSIAGNMRVSMLPALLLLLILSAPTFAASVTPLEQLRETVETILNVMQDKELSAPEQREERRERIMGLVQQRFDFAEMSQRTLGKNWQSRTDEEKKDFQHLFAELLKNTYVGRIDAYSDEKVEYAKEIFSPNSLDRARVYTNILKNNQAIPINYSLVKKGDEWFVYDVIIEGVSLVRNYRAEFGRILGNEDFAGLIKRMREKIESNEAQRETNG
ncbi:MAG: ABC transporter substrate-binding protein [Desulfobulbaceae bacterium]|nr:ABC transporter substrate-binding protein [Desulfobulbaceae bacterium]